MACVGMTPQATGLKQMRSEHPIHNTWSGQDLVFMFRPVFQERLEGRLGWPGGLCCLRPGPALLL